MFTRRMILETFNGLVFATSLLGFVLVATNRWRPSLWTQGGVIIVLVLVYVFVVYERTRTRIHKFDESATKFIKYFEMWYSQKGNLLIFCNDLEWLNNEESARIVFKLEQKGKNLKVYLKDPRGRIVQRLIESKAVIYQVKQGVRTDHRLSLLQQEGAGKIIIRNKNLEENRVEFIETDSIRDPYLFYLAEDFLDFCHDTIISGGADSVNQ